MRHEWRTLTADASLWTIVGILALAMGYGAVNGARWVQFQEQVIQDSGREQRERFAQHEAAILRIDAGEQKVSPFADPRNPQTAGSRLAARYAVMPPAPLAALSIGQSDLLPFYFKVTSDTKQNVTAGAELENPHRLLAGRFDLAFVFIYLYPLLILAICYNLISGEKEQGTLALALSQPMALRTLAIGKLALRFAVLLATILPLAAVALVMARVDIGADGVAIRLLLWLGAVIAYGLLWFAFAVAVAAAGRPSPTNATALAALWLAFVVLVPSLLNMTAISLYPVPSRVEMIQAVREASDEANARGSKLLARYYEDHPELATGGADQAMNDFSVIRVAAGEAVERQVRPVLARYEEQLDRQRRIVSRLRFLSPAILMQDALNDIAGSGTARHAHFLAQVHGFHDRWRGYFVPKIVRKTQLGSFADVPVFSFREEPLGPLVRRVSVGIGALVAGAAAIGLWALSRLRRYPVVG
jgi:ABC-2 type transport system permease protein